MCTVKQNYGFGNCLSSPIKFLHQTYLFLFSFLLKKYNLGNGIK